MHERSVLRAVIPGLLCLACGAPDAAVEEASPAGVSGFPRVEELADDVYSYEQLHHVGEETITTVSLFVVTPEGVLVADGQESVEETRRLVETIAGITDAPIRHVVIASDHGDHSAGNSAFPEDATFYAHPTSAATLEARAASTDSPPVVLPTVLVENELVLRPGGREIRIQHLGRAHTGGDLVVYVPDGRVLFMSEAYLNGVFPAMRSAYPSEWVAMIEAAQGLDVDVFVPGHGVVDAPSAVAGQLETYRQAMLTAIAEATRLHEAGLSLEDAGEQADFGDLEGLALADSQRRMAIWRVYMELDGELPE